MKIKLENRNNYCGFYVERERKKQLKTKTRLWIRDLLKTGWGGAVVQKLLTIFFCYNKTTTAQ